MSPKKEIAIKMHRVVRGKCGGKWSVHRCVHSSLRKRSSVGEQIFNHTGFSTDNCYMDPGKLVSWEQREKVVSELVGGGWVGEQIYNWPLISKDVLDFGVYNLEELICINNNTVADTQIQRKKSKTFLRHS